MTYRILITAQARSMLASISDRRLRSQIIKRIEGLANEPEKQGRALRNELSRYRSIRAAGQRFRIIYQVDRNEVRVIVIAVGIRRDRSRQDVYRLAQRLVRLGLIEPPQEE